MMPSWLLVRETAKILRIKPLKWFANFFAVARIVRWVILPIFL